MPIPSLAYSILNFFWFCRYNFLIITLVNFVCNQIHCKLFFNKNKIITDNIECLYFVRCINNELIHLINLLHLSFLYIFFYVWIFLLFIYGFFSSTIISLLKINLYLIYKLLLLLLLNFEKDSIICIQIRGFKYLCI